MNLTRSHLKAIFKNVFLIATRSRAAHDLTSVEAGSQKIFSFDIFDTLLSRSVLCPDHVFFIVGGQLNGMGLLKEPAGFWREIRKAAEQKITVEKYPSEIGLDDIYKEIKSDRRFSEETLAKAKEAELSVEYAVSRPVSKSIRLLNDLADQGHKVVLISDTYLPKSFVKSLLAKNEIIMNDDDIFISSELGQTKRSGSIFDKVETVLPSKHSRPLHIGDNFVSDVVRPRLNGWSSLFYQGSKENRFERTMMEFYNSTPELRSSYAGAARSVRLGNLETSDNRSTIWSCGAGIIGPLLVSYVVWCLNLAKERGLNHIYFLARDGQILLKVAEIVRPYIGYNGTFSYLYVSRKSLHLPAVTHLDETSISWIFELGVGTELRKFLSVFDLEFGRFKACVSGNSTLSTLKREDILTDEDMQAIVSEIRTNDLGKIVLSAAKLKRDACLSYFRQEGLFEHAQFGIVDIGWRGRLQRSLIRILATEDSDVANRITGLYVDLTERPMKCGSFETFSLNTADYKYDWARRGPVFEVFCAASHGSVLRYETDERGFSIPILESSDNIAAEVWGLGALQTSVLRFAEELVNNLILLQVPPIDVVNISRKQPIKLVRDFLENPTLEEAKAFGSFGHAEGEAHDHAEELAKPIQLNHLSFANFSKPRRGGRRISFWPEASIRRTFGRVLGTPLLHIFKIIPGRN